jgi:glycosyltransferase involved in cell wall biosynthesis
MNPVLVSVLMITYKHEAYIHEAIDNILKQETNFEYELVIANDNSPDQTDSIIQQFISNHQSGFRIKYVKNERNVGSRLNYDHGVLEHCSGKYIATCEGDDYWTDTKKLQKEVDFLEKNNEFSMVCTDYNKYHQTTRKFKLNCFKYTKYSSEVRFEDYILDRSTIGTATALYKKEMFEKYITTIPEEIRSTFNSGDTPLWLFIALNSRIAVLPDVTAVYRILNNSACHFDSIHNHYEFIMKGFAVPDYFINNFNVSESLKEKNELKKLTATMKYAFDANDKELFLKNYSAAKNSNQPMKKSVLLLRIGIMNPLTRLLVNKLLNFVK